MIWIALAVVLAMTPEYQVRNMIQIVLEFPNLNDIDSTVYIF